MTFLITERPVHLTAEQISAVFKHLGARYTKMQGENVQSGHCFLHGNSSPTLGASIHFPHQWNCFSCGAKGKDIVSLVCAAEKIDRPSAISWLYQTFELSGKKASFVLTQDEPDEAPPFVLSETVMAAYPLSAGAGRGYRAAEYYLGASKADADRFKLGYWLAKDYLLFPVRHPDGKLGGLIGRSMRADCPKKDRWYNMDSGSFKKERVLLGSELPVDKSKPMILVEGPRDFFKIRIHGWDNVRASLGTSISDFQLERMVSYGTPLILLLDADEAGEKARRQLILKRLKGRIPLWSYTFPEGYEDENGKADPAMLDLPGFVRLVSSFRQVFDFGANFAREKS